MHTAVKVGMATVVFSLLHSALASRRTKRMAAQIAGQRAYDGGYRAFYVSQSVVTFSLLILYAARLPTRTIYRIDGIGAALMRAGQIGGLICLLATAKATGISRLTGWSNLDAWLHGKPVPPAPVAQGPEMAPNGRLTTSGPYQWSRHPLNFSGIPIFWLTPHMTTRRLAFNLISTAYFIAGSVHEAVRLRQAYGLDYVRYEQSGVPFFWPREIIRLPKLHTMKKSYVGSSVLQEH